MRDIVLIPTFNEKENIASLIKGIIGLLPNVFITVVDDNSPDGTAEVVRQLSLQYPTISLLQRPGKEGLGLAYIDAFQRIIKDQGVRSVIMMDADFSHDPKYLPEIINRLDTHNVVIGSRYTAGGGTEGWRWHRRLLSKFGNWYCRFITRMPIRDCTAGFNGIHTDILLTLDFDRLKKFRGYAFMMALKYELWKKGARFYEVPIIFKDRTLGKSKMSQQIVREGFVTPWRLLLSSRAVRFVAVLTLIGLIFRLGAIRFSLPYDNVFGDEIAHVLAVFNLFENRTIIANFPFYYLPPLMAYLTAPVIGTMGIFGMLGDVFYGIAGFREFAILHREYFLAAPRIVSAIFGAATIPLLFLLARSLFSERIALWASLFLTFDFLHVHESQIGHIWAPIVFFTVSAMYCFLRVYETGETRWYWWSGILVGLGYGVGQIPIILYPWFLAAHMLSPTQRPATTLKRILKKNLVIGTSIFLLLVIIFTVLNPITFYKHTNDVIQAFDVFFGMHIGKVFDSPFTLASDVSSFSWKRNLEVIGTILFAVNPLLLLVSILGLILYIVRRSENIFKKFFLIGFSVIYLLLVSLIFYRLTIRYVLPATPFLLILGAYYIDALWSRHGIVKKLSLVIFSLSIAYSLVVTGYYFVLLQKPYTVSDGIEWMHKNIPSGKRIVSDRHIFSDKTSIQLLEKYNGYNALDRRKKLLLSLPDNKYPQPNYYIIDINALAVSKLTPQERKADYIFISYYYSSEQEEKRSVLTYYPSAKLIKTIYPKRSAQSVQNLLNLDPLFPLEIFHINQLGPNVEIFKINSLQEI